jgi:hypothetical protein
MLTKSFQVLTKTMKWASIGILLWAFWHSFSATYSLWSVTEGGYLELFQIVVWLTAIVVVVQAIRAGRYSYFMAAGFLVIVVLFNPVAPMTLTRNAFLWMDSFSMVMFLISLTVLGTQLRRSTSPALETGR